MTRKFWIGGLGLLIGGSAWVACNAETPVVPPVDPAVAAAVVENLLPPDDGPLTPEDVTVEGILESVEKLHANGFISIEVVEYVVADPEAFAEKVRRVIASPESFGFEGHEERLRTRGSEISDMIRSRVLSGMSTEDAKSEVLEIMQAERLAR